VGIFLIGSGVVFIRQTVRASSCDRDG
jgi:hypothetical protein